MVLESYLFNTLFVLFIHHYAVTIECVKVRERGRHRLILVTK